MRISAPKSLRLSKALRNGIVVRVQGFAAGRVVAEAKLGRRSAGAGTARLRKAGSVAVRVRLSRAVAAYVRRHHGAKLAIRVTFTPSRGQPTRGSATIRVTR